MDPITAAILGAISTGVASGATKVVEQSVSGSYSLLKDLLKRKFGSKSRLIKAIKELEVKPDSTARKDVVQEEVKGVKAEKDTEILQAAKALLKVIQNIPERKELPQNIIGNQNIQIAGDGNTISSNISKPKR